jgi:hypothetical protein
MRKSGLLLGILVLMGCGDGSSSFYDVSYGASREEIIKSAELSKSAPYFGWFECDLTEATPKTPKTPELPEKWQSGFLSSGQKGIAGIWVKKDWGDIESAFNYTLCPSMTDY